MAVAAETEMIVAIERAEGSTPSEKYLTKLAERTFLNLWCFPNTYIDKRNGSVGHGKELCDLLVICGNHVLIFSDKSISWPRGDTAELSWRRWYRRAVRKSVDQIRGAERWIRQYPDRIFLNRACTQRLPLEFPPQAVRQVHGVVVAHGAGDACKEFFRGGTGSLYMAPYIRGEQHDGAAPLLPFAIGDVDPSGPFVHVLDEATLDVVMRELDTVSDFTQYLSKKAQLMRSDHFFGAHGEEDLVAYYSAHMNSRGEHDFCRPDGSDWSEGESFVIAPATYHDFVTHRQYLAKRAADEDSYLWDKLIEAFTNHMLTGTAVVPEGDEFILSEYERCVRYMALVPRFMRRAYGAAILEVLDKGRYVDRFTRALTSPANSPMCETGFFFMTLKVPEEGLSRGYEQYRLARRRMLEIYALTFLHRYRHLDRVIGIATEPPARSSESNPGSSEDLIMAEGVRWTVETIRALEEQQRLLNIANPDNLQEFRVSGAEFPDVE